MNNFFKKNEPKIFCLSMQRTGTTSVGEFFRENGYKVVKWRASFNNNWSLSWKEGDFESIFQSQDFLNNQVFEDDPWWFPEFYKVLYHRFPNAKFILFTRDSEKWFNSMLSHSNGKTLGNTNLHCKVYRREKDFYSLLNEEDHMNYDEKVIDNLLPLKGYEEHYKNIYETRNREVVDFFKKNAPNALFKSTLEDPLKWKKLAEFIGMKIKENFDVHSNQSKL